MSEVIASAQHPRVKLVRRLARRRARDDERALVVEGEDLVAAGLAAGATARVLLVDAQRPPLFDIATLECPVRFVESRLLASMSTLAHPPRIIAVFDQPQPDDLATVMLRRAVEGRTGPWLALDALADPGNVGTIIRSTSALGGGGVITLPGSADPWSAKATRASMGACFQLPVVRRDAATDAPAAPLVRLRDDVEGARIVALDPSGEVLLQDTALDSRTIVVVGAERDGVGQHVLEVADTIVRIPQQGGLDSINAAVAASITLYEWQRCQRQEPT